MDSPIQITSGLTPEQLPKAIALFDTAFERKMSLAIPDVTVRRRFFGEIFSRQACLGALRDGEVIGAAGFQTPTTALSGGLTGRGVPWSTIRRYLGFFPSLRAALFFKLYERETDAETLLMDGIFVDEAARGLGIGKKLLEALIVYGEEHGFKTPRDNCAADIYARRGVRVGVYSLQYTTALTTMPCAKRSSKWPRGFE